MSEENTLRCHKISASFSQEGNTLGTTDEYEELIVDLECQTDMSEGYFVVLKTNGWSVDDVDHLKNIIDKMDAFAKLFRKELEDESNNKNRHN